MMCVFCARTPMCECVYDGKSWWMSHPALIIQQCLDLIHILAWPPIWNWPHSVCMYTGWALGTPHWDNKTKTKGDVMSWLTGVVIGKAAAWCLKWEKRNYQQGRQQRGCGCLEFRIRTQEVQLKAAGKCIELREIIGVNLCARECLYELLCEDMCNHVCVSVRVWAAAPLVYVGFGCWFDYSVFEPRTLSTSVFTTAWAKAQQMCTHRYGSYNKYNHMYVHVLSFLPSCDSDRILTGTTGNDKHEYDVISENNTDTVIVCSCSLYTACSHPYLYRK